MTDKLEYIEISAKNVDDCITEACEHFAVTSDRLEYEVIQQGSTGFLGLAVKPAIIRARVAGEGAESSDSPAQAEAIEEADTPAGEAAAYEAAATPGSDEEPAEAPQRKRSIKGNTRLSIQNDEYPEDSYIQNESTEAAAKFLTDVFKAMDMEVRIDARFQPDDRILEAELSGDDMGVLIGKRGQTLDSLQYLVSLVVNRDSEAYIHVKLDTENYRERRKNTLENLARNIAYKVRKSRTSISLEPMNPYERRIIHSALQSDRYVTTHSEGEEPYRYVVVSLKR